MAPEQAGGAARDRPPCDVYSLALTLYEALDRGRTRSARASPAATARRVGRPLPPLRSRRGDLPPALCEVIDAALDPEPGYRPAPAELREVLARRRAGTRPTRAGLVEPETLERFGLTRVMPRTAGSRTAARTVATRAGRPSAAAAPAAALPVADVPDQAPGTDLPLVVRIATRARPGWRPGASSSRRSRGWAPRRRSRPPPLPARWRWRSRCCRASAGSPRRSASAPGSPPPRPTARARRSCWPRRSRPCPCCSRARACCGRCPALAPLLGVVALAPLFVGSGRAGVDGLAAGRSRRRRLRAGSPSPRC